MLRSGMDGYTANLSAAIVPLNSNLSVAANNIFQIADAATTAQEGCVVIPGESFTNISTPIRVRWYGFNAETTGGTFSIDNVKIEGVVR
ncbi:hypothetical protein [Niabella hibiscisoli]|uniref:hypothetical protein n=1 Tax=Niabella hibiscisoli TaxID=1825928 RepID=UPI001F108262|nr:hypothetical protein [Niabella hibiscisoli]MCH5715824.1 hypothetical protein [Niabella hibiscisoli]